MRATLLFAAAAVLSGCATGSHSQPTAAFGSKERSCQTDTADAASVNPRVFPEPERGILNRDHGEEQPGISLWDSAHRPGLALISENTASDTNSTNPPPEPGLFSKDYLKLVVADVKETLVAPAQWGARDWLLFGGVAAGIGTVAVFDEDIQQAVQRNRNGTVDGVFNEVEPFGTEYAFGTLGAFYLGGEIFNDWRAKAVALDGLSASVIASGLILYPIKYTVGRSRPSQHLGAYHFDPFGGRDSFPSGHTTEAFAVATAIAEHYDSLWIKVTSYGVASMVGYARLNNNAHWGSDVLSGAALGTLVGHVVVRFNRKHWEITAQPVIGPRLKGSQLSFSF